jgi:FSR family fosmidomycin resistance protein-like MFS transporter
VSAQASAAPLRQDVRVIGLVASAHGLSHFYQLVIAVLFPLIKDDLGVSYAALGATVALFYTVSGVCQTLAGFAVDRYGARRVLITGLALCSAGVLLAGVSRSYEMLVVAALIAGIGNSVFHPADFAILNARVYSGRLGYAFSFHGVGGNLGWALAPAFSYGVSALYGWHVALIGAAILGPMMIALLLANGEAIAVAGRSTAHGAPKASLAEDARVLLAAPVVMCFLYFLLLSVAFTGVQIFGVTSMVALYQVPVALASTALTAYLLASAAGVLFGGWVATRVTRHDLVAAAGLLSGGLGILVMAFAPLSPWALAPLLAFAGFSTGITGPSRDMLVRSATPPGSAGKVYGFVYSGLDVGSMATPVFYGWLIDRGMPQVVFIAVFIATLLTIATVLQLPGQARRQRRAAATGS